MNNNRKKKLICTFLIVATISVYLQVKDHNFINHDDDLYVTKSRLVQSDFTSQSIIQIFTNTHAFLYLPITTFSYFLDYQLYGLNPKGFLLTNLFLHIANSLLLFLILFRMTGAIWKSAFVAAMFAFHPLNVESVAWISERKNVLSTLFFLLTTWAYINYLEKPTWKMYGLVLLFFALGLMSKPMLVTLPFVLLLLDYWPLRRLKLGQKINSREISEKDTGKRLQPLQLVLEKIPLFFLSICFTALMFYTIQINLGFYLSFESRLNNATVSYLEYLGKMIWPSGLSIFYAHPENTLLVWKGIMCGMLLVGITIISITLIRKAPYFSVGWFWYLGTLLPVSGVFQTGAHSMADHYSYITLIGIFIIIAWGLPELISKWQYKKIVLSVSAGIIILALLITTWHQVGHWKNSITIFKHAIKVTDKKHPNFSLVYNNLGLGLYDEGKNEEAISNYMMAIKLNPMHAIAHYNLGIALYAQGNNVEAISNYKIAIKLKPNFAYAHYNLGLVLLETGKAMEAVHHFRRTIMLRPDLDMAQRYLELEKLR